MVNECCPDLPLVLVSGAIDVPTALEAMKAGAKDFVLKGDPQRLPSVVERELAEAVQRRDRRRAEEQRDQALDELREANEQLAAFARLTALPLTGTSPERLLEDLLGTLVEAIGADGATVLLLGEDGRLVVAGATGPLAGSIGSVELGSGFAGAIAAENRSRYVRDASGDEHVERPETRESGIRSMLGVPMHHAGRVVGVLHVDWCSVFEPPRWQRPLLEIAADSCAMAIENARLYQHEHAIAETLQSALLSASTSIPRLEVGHFYGSATVETLVGGDFYDVFETAEGVVAFSIGDVSGKGLAAASVTALVKNALRALAIDGSDPHVVMNKSNDVVVRFTDPDTFVTAIYGHLDLETGALTYCNAGHPPLAVVGPDGVRLLTEHGPLLGTFPGVEYSLAEAHLAPCECLVVYTDGLTEARSPDGTFYGSERLEALLSELHDASPQDIAARLFEEVWEFSARKLRDDIAVLALRPRAD